MTGYPQFNFPAFTAAAAVLREYGYEIISPAELDSNAVKVEALNSTDGKLHNGKIAGETWGEILARDVKIVADSVDGLVFLPGWESSRGARLEAFVGLLCGHRFAEYNPEVNGAMMPLEPDMVKDIINAVN
jgi:hypothetical protein